MSSHRTSPPDRYRQPEGRGPNGRRLCRGCHEEVPAGRRSWCGRECEHEFQLRINPAYVRQQVFKRDGGVCALCGLDCAALEAELRGLRHSRDGGSFAKLRERVRELRERRFTLPYHGQRTLWEADHIIPVSQGGGECGLDNYRTLCTPCHKKVTTEARRRLTKQEKRARKRDRPIQPDLAELLAQGWPEKPVDPRYRFGTRPAMGAA